MYQANKEMWKFRNDLSFCLPCKTKHFATNAKSRLTSHLATVDTWWRNMVASLQVDMFFMNASYLCIIYTYMYFYSLSCQLDLSEMLHTGPPRVEHLFHSLVFSGIMSLQSKHHMG